MLCYKYHNLTIFIVVFRLKFTPPYSLNTQRGWHTSEFHDDVRRFVLSQVKFRLIRDVSEKFLFSRSGLNHRYGVTNQALSNMSTWPLVRVPETDNSTVLLDNKGTFLDRLNNFR